MMVRSLSKVCGSRKRIRCSAVRMGASSREMSDLERAAAWRGY
jgi:hypothetical protein